MHRRIINYLNKEFSGLHEAAFLLGGSAFLSQILALFRDRLFASSFGSGATLDTYYASFKIPDFLFASIASFVSVTVLIPFIVERLNENNTDKARSFFNSVFTAFFVTMVVVSGLVWLIIPLLAPFIVPGFSEEALAKFISLSRILLLSPFLLGLSNLLGSVTQAYKKFFIFALTPIVYNLGIIIGIIFFYPLFGLAGLAYGVVLGALSHASIQLPALAGINFLPKFTANLQFSELRRVVLTSLPRTLALATDKIALLILVSVASLMSAGAITVFNLAFNLQSVPLAIVGVSYSVAAFPALAQIFRSGNREEFLLKISTAVRHIIFWSLPATMIFIVVRAQIVRVLYGAGHFDWTDTRLTAAALALFSVSVVAQSLILLFVRAFYAGGKTFIPLVINSASSLTTVVLAFLGMRLFEGAPIFQHFIESLLRVADVPNTVVLILPLACSVGYILNATLLWNRFVKEFGSLRAGVGRALRQSLAAAIIGGYAAYGALAIAGNLLNLNTVFGIFTQGLAGGLVGLVVIIIILKLLGNEELREVDATLTHKFWRNKSVVVEQNI